MDTETKGNILSDPKSPSLLRGINTDLLHSPPILTPIPTQVGPVPSQSQQSIGIYSLDTSLNMSCPLSQLQKGTQKTTRKSLPYVYRPLQQHASDERLTRSQIHSQGRIDDIRLLDLKDLRNYGNKKASASATNFHSDHGGFSKMWDIRQAKSVFLFDSDESDNAFDRKSRSEESEPKAQLPVTPLPIREIKDRIVEAKVRRENSQIEMNLKKASSLSEERIDKVLHLQLKKLEGIEKQIVDLKNQIKENSKTISSFSFIPDSLAKLDKRLDQLCEENIDLKFLVAKFANKCEALEETIDSNSEIKAKKVLSHEKFDSGYENSEKGEFEPLSNNHHVINYDELIKKVRELNNLQEKDQTLQMCFNSGGASFKKRLDEVFDLTLYKNGIVFDHLPRLWKFNHPRCSHFIMDICDGFFPSELKSKYPDGVIFNVNDKRIINFSTPSQLSFKGAGHKLGKMPLPKLLPGPMSIISQTILPLEIKDVEKTSSDSTVASIESMFNELPGLVMSMSISKWVNKNPDLKMEKCIWLKIHNLINGSRCKVQVNILASIQEVLDHLKSHLPELKKETEYELVNIVPYGVLSSVNSTLKTYEIDENAVFQLQRKGEEAEIELDETKE